ncbi:putative ATP-dependent helicase [Nymphon striatum]|nr:putative ATP-dependent helicase [Nymphon striatum]
MAHELHDSLAQTLASLRFKVRLFDDSLNQGKEEVIWHELEGLENTIDDAYAELRSLITHFRAPIDGKGVVRSVQRLTERFQIEVVRIVQEALANVRKHSQAANVRILMSSTEEGHCSVLVEDDGVGLPLERKKTNKDTGEHIVVAIRDIISGKTKAYKVIWKMKLASFIFPHSRLYPNDIQINLQQPIQGVRDELLGLGLHDVELNAWVRTGDTPQSERAKASKTPPHILVTTPESIYILLTSESGRNMLKTVETVIVDEIHAVAGSKRGSHLSLSLERLESLVKKTNPKKTLQRIGLSATQKPIETMANFLLGNPDEECTIIDTGHSRQRDLQLVIPHSPLDAVMSNEIWEEIYQKLEQYAYKHNSMLVFVNTRRLAERAARFIAERIGEENVMAHHGSMSKEKRLEAEKRLKRGELKCLVATASLELGIDIGDIDLVCQLGSPRSIAAFCKE